MSDAIWSVNRKQPSDLACAIVRDLFESMSTDCDVVQRIEFIGGEWPDNETNMGGFCEEALARRLDTALKDAIFKSTDHDEKEQ